MQIAAAFFAATTGAGMLLVTTPVAGVVRRVPVVGGAGGGGAGVGGAGGGAPVGGQPGAPPGQPMCAWDLLMSADAQAALADAAAEIGPYAILRQALPNSLGGWTAYWDAGSLSDRASTPVGSESYYVTAAIFLALAKTPYTVEQFAAAAGGQRYSLLLPGCLIPATAVAEGTPLRELITLYRSGVAEFPEGV